MRGPDRLYLILADEDGSTRSIALDPNHDRRGDVWEQFAPGVGPGQRYAWAVDPAQPLLDPLVVSWGWEPKNPGPSKFVEFHEWQGSRDISAYLVVPDTIAFQEAQDWPRVRIACRSLAMEAQKLISDLFGLEPYHPPTPEWHGQIVCARLPAGTDDVKLLNQLRHEHAIDISVDKFGGLPRVRISIQAYNDASDVERLLAALKSLLL